MFVAGLVVGAVAASFFMGLNSNDPESIGRGIEHMISASRDRFENEAPPPPASPGKKASTEFDFYMLLPEIEHIVPESPPEAPTDADRQAVADDTPSASPADTVSAPQSAAQAPATPEPVAAGSRYELQAGAFVRMTDADRLKAELALKGLTARIQKVSIQGRGDFFRVRLGPFGSTSELESVDRQLAGLGIDALRLKISGG